MQISLSVKNSSKVSKTNITWCLFLLDVVSYNKHFTQLPISLEYNTGRYSMWGTDYIAILFFLD